AGSRSPTRDPTASRLPGAPRKGSPRRRPESDRRSGPPAGRRPGSLERGGRMSAAPPELPPDVARLVDQKKFEDLEALFTQRVDETPEDLPFFFALAAAVKKKGSGGKALSWLKLLADDRAAAGDLAGRTRVLLEIARMSPSDPSIRGDLAATLKERFGQHPSYAAVAAQFTIEKAR